MPFDIHFDSSNEILVTEFLETITLHERKTIVGGLTKLLANNPRLPILINAQKALDLTTEDERIEFGHFLSTQKNHFEQTKVAVLVKQARDQALPVSIAYNDGFSRMVEFTDKNDAIRWLTGEIR